MVSLEALQGNGINGCGNVSLPSSATAVYGVTVINGDNVNLWVDHLYSQM